jgi:hypothetical protein
MKPLQLASTMALLASLLMSQAPDSACCRMTVHELPTVRPLENPDHELEGSPADRNQDLG